MSQTPAPIPPPRTAVVSALYTGVNSNRSVEAYLEFGAPLMACQTPKVVFVGPDIYPQVQARFAAAAGTIPRTLIVPLALSELYLEPHRASLTRNFHKVCANPTKDTADYMILICYKSEFVRRAIQLLPHADQFVFLDFGVTHVSAKTPAAFTADLDRSLRQWRSPTRPIRFGSVRPPSWHLDPSQDPHMARIFRNVVWVFAGGMFGGGAAPLLEFADRVRQKCLAVIRDRGLLVWEVNIWYLVARDCPELFDLYPCDHDDTLVSRFADPNAPRW